MKPFEVAVVNWHTHCELLRHIRHEVFVREQNVPESEEWDEYDLKAIHLLVGTADGIAVGTARILENGKITRMAVLSHYRNCGAGSLMLSFALELLASKGIEVAWLNAQIQARNFYATHGFSESGKEFLEAGIVHVTMKRPL